MMIEVKNLSCGYSQKPVIREINLEIKAGEFIGLIGPNGSGKTTLFRALSGILPLRSGEVKIAGQFLTSYSRRSLAKIIAVVPQNTNISFSFLVEDIVIMGRMPYLKGLQWESEKDRQIAKEMMMVTDIAHLAERPINELSGGEAQRVIIARALTQEPQILFLDEPTAFLDINHQIEIYDLLKKLNIEQKLTILTISHDLNLASLYCDRLILLKEGRIYKSGSSSEVLTEKILKEVYGSEVEVNSLNSRPYLILKSQYYQKNIVKNVT